jgi:hypothetical protein
MSLDNITDNKNIPTCEAALRSKLFLTLHLALQPFTSASTLSMALCCKHQSHELEDRLGLTTPYKWYYVQQNA